VVTESKLDRSLGVRTAQVFTVSTVLGSAEGERCQAGPRFSPRYGLPSRFHFHRWVPPAVAKRNEFGTRRGFAGLFGGIAISRQAMHARAASPTSKGGWHGPSGERLHAFTPTIRVNECNRDITSTTGRQTLGLRCAGIVSCLATIPPNIYGGTRSKKGAREP